MDVIDVINAINKGRLVYTCKCGWIDTGHANPKSSRPTVGPAYLWSQIKNESGRRPKFPGSTGFQVTYTQDAVWSFLGIKMYPGVTRSYRVNEGLSLAEKESVALGIFQEVSYAFEQKQLVAFWSGSGFSIEDLASNLLSFYTIVRPGIDYLKLCTPVGKEASLKLLGKYPNTFSTKNRDFTPKFFDCDSCASKGPFLEALQKITPAKKGTLYSDWLDMYDWPGGIPPLTGPKY